MNGRRGLAQRGISQALFGFLPDQTVDLQGRVWRVSRWVDPLILAVDAESVRRDLLRVIQPWVNAGRDNGLGDVLRTGRSVTVACPSERGGIEVERFPEVYRCRECGRIGKSDERPCSCGRRAWTQFPFVAYHKCGKLDEPWIPPCRTHREVRVALPGSATTRDLRFQCPECGTSLGSFPYLRCDCGDGTLDYNIHRAGVVYAPRSTVIVNPPTPEVAMRLRSDSAAELTLRWVLDGMQERDPLAGRPTLDSLVASFVGQGFDEPTARAMAEAAAERSGGKVATESTATTDLPLAVKAEAIDGATKLAFAVGGGRVELSDLVERAGPALRARYESLYPSAIARARLGAVELLENFPVLTAIYGYTRGEFAPGATTLRWFRADDGGLAIHGHKAETEGLLFRFDPLTVARWLGMRGWPLGAFRTAREARLAILRECTIPDPGEIVEPPTPGSELLSLVHSMAHRVIRKISAFSGIERDALAEYLIPLHLGFVVYATTRGDFVLGGLQALYEYDLDKSLTEVAGGERRCPLDPGCRRNGSACVACLHVGEPSCRYYNQFLSRDILFGPRGYLTV